MKFTARTQAIGIALYALPFLAIIGFSLFFVWAGDIEMVLAGLALLPAVLYCCGLRWCRYVVGGVSVIALLTCLMILLRGMERGRYFWLVWSPICLIYAFASLVSILPVRPTVERVEADNPG